MQASSMPGLGAQQLSPVSKVPGAAQMTTPGWCWGLGAIKMLAGGHYGWSANSDLILV